jgi:hypothetical protein
MSGGKFNYYQYQITDIIDTIQSQIERNGRKKTKQELKEESWHDPEWYEKYPEDLCHYKYPDEVIEQFKIAVQKLKEAQVYAHRVDWLLSGDDGEESFLKRLREDLLKIYEPELDK